MYGLTHCLPETVKYWHILGGWEPTIRWSWNFCCEHHKQISIYIADTFTCHLREIIMSKWEMQVTKQKAISIEKFFMCKCEWDIRKLSSSHVQVSHASEPACPIPLLVEHQKNKINKNNYNNKAKNKLHLWWSAVHSVFLSGKRV